MLRTHTCGELTRDHLGQTVSLTGWVDTRRDLGGVFFIDLRDRYGLTQLNIDPSKVQASELRNEWVIRVEGIVKGRPEAMVNSNLTTGAIEVEVTRLDVLSQSEPLPFEINNEDVLASVKEGLRLEYRFLDLRRPKLQQMLKTKDELFTHLRQYFHARGFVEIQTPILANSSPEGARDFLIPSRLYPGECYALPQAPQQFKQLLMVGGVDRYFQIAPCFRDEDTRNDRHYGEFYQFDMEMSFVGQEDIFEIMEPVMKEITEKFSSKEMIGLEPNGRFRRLAWREAMERYGSDKPDLRYSLEITNVSGILTASGFEHFDNAIAGGGVVHALRIPKAGSFSRKVTDELKEIASRKKIAAFATVSLDENGTPKTSLSKFISDDTIATLVSTVKAQPDDLLVLVAGAWREVCESLGAVRKDCAVRLNLLDSSKAAWCWIVDFPMYDYSDITPDKIDFGHNPFSMPQGGHEAIDTKDPLDILAYQYDLVLNGFEISSGGVRNHDPELLVKVFAKAGYPADEVERRFGALIRAFRYGVPPHAGNAPGVDRLLMVLNDWESIRDMYAFPKDGQGRDVLMGSPSPVDQGQIDELGLTFKKK